MRHFAQSCKYSISVNQKSLDARYKSVVSLSGKLDAILQSRYSTFLVGSKRSIAAIENVVATHIFPEGGAFPLTLEE
jgi:hypothetical protein